MAAAGSFLTHRLTVRVAQIATGLFFLAASLGKLGDLNAFAAQVHNYRIVWVGVQNLIAMTLPWVELVAALALILGIRARAGAVVTAGLMLVFTLAVAAAWARGLDFECGCFGKASASRIGAQKFFENVGMSLLAIAATIRPRTGA